MTQKILGISGRKQAGKNTVANFLIGLMMSSLGIVHHRFMIDKNGRLAIEDLYGDKRFEGIFDVQRNTPEMKQFREDALDPYIKLYSFADLLKQEVCVNILGLTWEQCYGGDDDKNSLTHLKWEDMPGITCDESYNDRAVQEVCGMMLNECLQYHEPGQMTAREVLQYVGTDIFRKMYGNVWADATIKKVKEDGADLAIICDARFPNEVNTVQNAGGKVMRLARNPFNDQHASETALDPENFDWNTFDWIVDNKDMNIGQQNDAVYTPLAEIGWIPEIKG